MSKTASRVITTASRMFRHLSARVPRGMARHSGYKEEPGRPHRVSLSQPPTVTRLSFAATFQPPTVKPPVYSLPTHHAEYQQREEVAWDPFQAPGDEKNQESAP